MNIQNNQRRKDSQERIQDAFLQLIQNNQLHEIKVTDLVKLAGVNRSTFYANYIDIYDLVDQLKARLREEYRQLYKQEYEQHIHSYNYLPMFQDIKKNQRLYRTLFQLNYDFTDFFGGQPSAEDALQYYETADDIDYHVAFFQAGMAAIIRRWLADGCRKSPEEMDAIVKAEYQGKTVRK